eukprot:EG_transcript_12462
MVSKPSIFYPPRLVLWTIFIPIFLFQFIAISRISPLYDNSLFSLIPCETAQASPVIFDVPSQWFFFIAGNFVDSATVLEEFIPELKKLVLLLGPHRVFISFFENGSRDTTPDKLRALVPWLQHHRVNHSVVVRQTIFAASRRPKEVGRIKWMAEVRNHAMEPLYHDAQGWLKGKQPGDLRVLFFNDVFWRVPDVLRLLRTEEYRYDVACAMDFYSAFYDTWVTRDLQGRVLAAFYPYGRDPDTQRLVRQGRPFPVRSCWNGLVVLKAAPFLRPADPVRFREGAIGQCNASECQLLCEDFRQLNLSRIFVNPQVRVAYTRQAYHCQHAPLMPFVHWTLDWVQVWLWKPFLSPDEAEPGAAECGMAAAWSAVRWNFVALGLLGGAVVAGDVGLLLALAQVRLRPWYLPQRKE